MSLLLTLALTLTTYLLAISLLLLLLLHHALATQRKKYAYLIRNPYSMPLATAHEILLTLLTISFPVSFALSGQIALLTSYSIASGTKLLVSTRRLSTKKGIGKRVEDTAIIFSKILTSGVDSQRGLKTLAKLNWIHRQYGTRITNEEMIHTLALNVLGPLQWIERFEARLSPISVSGSVDESTGRVRREKWAFEPWYVAESSWSSILRKWLGLDLWMGRPVPGPEWESQGYLPEELGPKEFRERSRADVLDHAEKMGEYARQGGGAVLGCPFAFGGLPGYWTYRAWVMSAVL
ncbi:hypothetical protein BDV06DRAFT_221248 [Aspergillus oleicola]